jgi:hypothetical protein
MYISYAESKEKRKNERTNARERMKKPNILCSHNAHTHWWGTIWMNLESGQQG